MSLNLDIVGHHKAADAPWNWSERDTLFYALSIGAGDAEDDADLAFTTQNSRDVPQQVLPSYPVVMGMGQGDTSMSDFGDFSLSQVLHAGQKVVLHTPIPPAGSAMITNGVSAIYDKGENALIETVGTFRDATSGELIAESIGQIIVRGEGGFNGDPGPRQTWSIPERAADDIVTYQTRPNQALLYRLNGDYNPLHSDPKFAEMAGFPRPILHGLCSFGIASRALLATAAGGDVGRFGSFSGRFSSPTFPGERLETRVWRTEDGALFQTLAGDRVVIDRGEFTLR